MIILVCGGREFKGRGILHAYLDKLHRDTLGGITRVIHGNARGADTLAKHWAEMNKVQPTPYPAQWAKYGNAAGPVRNQQMLDEEPGIELVVAFPGGTGTADMIERALAKGIPVHDVDETGNIKVLSPRANRETTRP